MPNQSKPKKGKKPKSVKRLENSKDVTFSQGDQKDIIRKLSLTGQSTTITLKSRSVKELTENFEGKSDETGNENTIPDLKNP